MCGVIRRALDRLRRGHYSDKKTDSVRPTPRRARAAEALRRMRGEHEHYALLHDYVAGEKLTVLATKYGMSESTVNRVINACISDGLGGTMTAR